MAPKKKGTSSTQDIYNLPFDQLMAEFGSSFNNRFKGVRGDFNKVVPTADEFAAALGIIEGRYASVPKSGHDRTSIVASLNMKLELAKLSKPFMAEEVHAEFCAKYLPQTIEGFINLPPLTDDDYEEDDELRDEVYDLDNSFSLMLTLVKASPYFVRYLQSSHPCASPGKKFVGIYAKRLYDNALTLDMRWKKAFPGTEEPVVEHARDTVMNSLGFLQTILLSVTDLKTGLGEIIDFDTREGLLIFVKKWLWDLKREGHARGDEAKHLIPLLVGDMTQLLKAEYYTRLMRNALNCAVPGCDKGEQLKACGRCKTVRYCSTQHQKLHWAKSVQPGKPPHKSLCHSTEY